MRHIQIQSADASKKGHTNLVHVDPWTILDDKGTVENQDVTLVGFVKQIPFKHIDVDFQTFYGNPYMAVGKYAVFADKNGEWSADKNVVTDAVVVKE
jgi:hypothetical protein